MRVCVHMCACLCVCVGGGEEESGRDFVLFYILSIHSIKLETYVNSVSVLFLHLQRCGKNLPMKPNAVYCIVLQGTNEGTDVKKKKFGEKVVSR